MLHQLHHYILYSIERVGKVHESTQVPYAISKVPMTPRGYGEMWPAWPQMSGMSGLPAIPGNLPMRWLPHVERWISYDFHEKVGTLEMNCLPLVAKSAAVATDVVAVRAPGSVLRCCKCSWRWRMVSRTAHVPDKVQSRRQLRSPQKPRWMVKFNKPQSIGSRSLWELLPPAMMSWVSISFPKDVQNWLFCTSPIDILCSHTLKTLGIS